MGKKPQKMAEMTAMKNCGMPASMVMSTVKTDPKTSFDLCTAGSYEGAHP